MGGSSSKQETENSGQVQNTISVNTISDTVHTYGTEIIMLLSAIVLIKILELFIFIYKSYRRQLRREFARDQARDQGRDQANP